MNIKAYADLYKLYRRTQGRLKAAFFILLATFLAAFALADESGDLFDLAMVVFVISFFSDIAVGIVCLVFRHTAKRSLSRFTPAELERINREIASAPMLDGFAVTRDAVIGSKNKLFLYPVRDVLWVYKSVHTTSLYGVIPVFKTSALIVAGRDGKRYPYAIKNRSNVMEFLCAGLQQYRRGIFYGHNNDLDQMFRKDIGSLIRMSEEQDARACDYDQQQYTSRSGENM